MKTLMILFSLGLFAVAFDFTLDTMKAATDVMQLAAR